MLSILNNLSAMSAENSLSLTQSNLQNTLTQLSTGLRINSGSDDAAGLSIANGLQANIAALTQSSQNATDGVGMLQTADGALSQVTTLLNRAVTLATEAANGTVTGTQAGAVDTEFQSILSEVNQIGQTTDYNGQNVFSSANPTASESAVGNLTMSTALTSGKNITIKDQNTGGTFVYTAGSSSTVSTLQAAVNNAISAGTLSAGTTVSIDSANNNQLKISAGTGDSVQVSTNDTAVLGQMNAVGSNNTTTTFISDGTQSGASNTTITTTINALSSSSLGLSGSSLATQAGAQSALALINSAVGLVASQRGDIGASVNRLTAASNVMTSQVQNLTSAENNIMNADVGKTVANMTQYNILESTGMAALQQANQSQQSVLKLLQ